jgi:hypothetical protein
MSKTRWRIIACYPDCKLYFYRRYWWQAWRAKKELESEHCRSYFGRSK